MAIHETVTVKPNYWTMRYTVRGYDGCGQRVCEVEWIWPDGNVCRTSVWHLSQKEWNELLEASNATH